tara:strand:- start:756 stop:1112 length:357 start_codon:yes stop_codon:yes gene_type:complete
MLSILGKILGTGDVVKKGLDLIDDLHTSTEEEIVAKTKSKVDLLSAYAPFKVAQRYLALMFSITFLSCFTLTLGMTLSGTGDIEGVKAVLGDFYIGPIMFAIVGFYFGGGAIESFKRK